MESLVLSMFLYFPQDKTEYIPAAISFFFFFVACVLTFRLILRVSQKEARKAKELEEKLLQKEQSGGNS
ncbi:hypothetical protein A8F94_06915 [Bacillus sp. FJAT-27225]|uniref:hypothetical protein n=1 Tax=Bacillus sp. FJAT-27225 TaxID=1743144 RepID=UPI00080C2329|nr:hypothetical protein [Bacillus sp. FJAT-27225]OCA87585.1 hypothetical protein A8F94_06915 [Bacillus sp. FJAT-27225]